MPIIEDTELGAWRDSGGDYSARIVAGQLVLDTRDGVTRYTLQHMDTPPDVYWFDWMHTHRFGSAPGTDYGYGAHTEIVRIGTCVYLATEVGHAC